MLIVANTGGIRHPSLSMFQSSTVKIIDSTMGDSYYIVWRLTARAVLSCRGNQRILFVRNMVPTLDLLNALQTTDRDLIFCRELDASGKRVSFDWWSCNPHQELDHSENTRMAYGDVDAFSIYAQDLLTILDSMPAGILHKNEGHNIRLAEYARHTGLVVRLCPAGYLTQGIIQVPLNPGPAPAAAPNYPRSASAVRLAGAKLHLGCGGKKIAGYLNTDCVAKNGPDGVIDIQNLNALPANTYAVVYASHVLEHTYVEETPAILNQMFRILQPGGTVRLAVPDLRLIVANCVDTQEFGPDANAPLFGDYRKQALPFDRHWQAFWYERLANLLTQAGFAEIRRWTTDQYPEIAEVHDWASYNTITLNVEADKPVPRPIPERKETKQAVSSLSAPESIAARVKVSVLLGTVNRTELLQECVESIRESIGDFSYEIVVAYGTEDDSSLSWMRGEKDIRPILGGMQGAIEAFNRAYEVSVGEYICQLNDDILVVGDSITNAVKLMEGSRDIDGVVFSYDRRDGAGYRHEFIGGKLHPNQMVVRRDVCELVVEKLGAFWGDAAHRTDKTYGGDSAFGMMCHHYGLKLVNDAGVKCIDRMNETLGDPLRVINGNLAIDHGTRWHAMYPVSLISSVESDPWGHIYVPARGKAPRRSPFAAGRPLRTFHIGLYNADESLTAFRSALAQIGPYVDISWPGYLEQGAHALAEKVLGIIHNHKPELIFTQIQDVGIDPELLVAMRKTAGPNCTIVNWSGDVRTSGLAPLAPWMFEFGKLVDLMLFSNCTYPEKLTAAGIGKSGYVQCGYDPSYNRPQGAEKPGIVFAGGSHYTNFGSPDRIDMCRAVNTAFPGQLTVFGGGDSGWGVPNVRPRISFLECALEYAIRQVVLSISLFHDLRRYTSDRLKRAMGCGAVIALRKFDDYEGLGIVDGVHAMVWETHAELIDKIKTLLDDGSLRANMRGAANSLAESRYTWPIAIEEMLAIIRHYRRSKGLV